MKPIFWPYLIFGFWIILGFLLRPFVTPFEITVIFLALIFVPGFALARILKINYQDDRLGNIILWLALGSIYNVVLAFLALFINLKINQLVGLTLVADLLLFLGAFIYEWFQPPTESKPFDWRSLWKLENLIYVLLGIFIILVLATVSQLGANFTGDPLDHLSIMRKVYDGQPISIENISWLKNQFFSVYIFAPWHIFLTVATKITGATIFTLWWNLPVVLSLLVIMVWYWFLLKLLPNRYLAVLGLFLFILYQFGPNAYLFTRLPVPDTLCQLMLLPLVFALALKYIFNQDSSWKHLIVLSLLAAVTGLIHWTQYFYYLLITGLFIIVYAVFKYREENFKSTLKKIALTGFANLIIVLPILAYIQFKGHTISQNIQAYQDIRQTFQNVRFSQFQFYFKFAFLALPFLILFFKKYPKFIFLLAIFLIGPLVFNFPGVEQLFYKYFSYVFVKRFYSSVEWPFVVWTLVLGFIIVLIDRMITKLNTISEYLRYTIDTVLAIIVIGVIWSQFQSEKIANFYDRIFSESTRLWINERYYWLIPFLILIAFSIFVWQRYSKKLIDFFDFDEPRDKIAAVLLLFIVVFFFSSPAQGHLSTFPAKEFKNGTFWKVQNDPTTQIINFEKFGGQATIDFIRASIPPKSVFDTTDANYILPMFVDVHMASLTYESEPTKKYEKIYDSTISESERMTLTRDGQIEYILYLYSGNYGQGSQIAPFDQYPNDFSRVYSSNTTAIYKVLYPRTY